MSLGAELSEGIILPVHDHGVRDVRGGGSSPSTGFFTYAYV